MKRYILLCCLQLLTAHQGLRETKWHERSFSTLLPSPIIKPVVRMKEESKQHERSFSTLLLSFIHQLLGKRHERTCTYVTVCRCMDIYMYVRGREIVNIYSKYRENRTFIFFSDDTNMCIYIRAKSAFEILYTIYMQGQWLGSFS